MSGVNPALTCLASSTYMHGHFSRLPLCIPVFLPPTTVVMKHLKETKILIMAASRGTAGVEAGPPSRKTTVGWASGGSGSTPTA
jgi:hypothetical protein